VAGIDKGDMPMELGVRAKGWTVIDDDDGTPACAISLKTAVRTGARPQVLAAAQAPQAAEGAEAQTLRDLVRQTDKGLPMLVTLGRSRYRLRVMPEPAVPRRELLSSVRWTLSSESDNPGEEFSLAWMEIPSEELTSARQKQGYAVVAPRPWLDQRQKTWRDAGVRPRVVDIRETALRNIARALETSGEGVGLVSMDGGGVGMVFVHQGSLYLDRYVELPLAGLRTMSATERGLQFERIATQVMRSVDVVHRTYPFVNVKRIVVAPEPEPVGLFDHLVAHVPMPVQPLQLDQVFDLEKVPGLASSPALQARCLVALGAALRSARSAA
jgi:hypothetical protein